MIREPNSFVEFQLFWKGSNECRGGLINVSLDNVTEKIIAFIPNAIPVQKYVPLLLKIEVPTGNELNEILVESINYPPTDAQTMKFNAKMFLSFEHNSLAACGPSFKNATFSVPKECKELPINIKDKPKFNEGEHYRVYIKNINGSLQAKFKLKEEDHFLGKEVSLSELRNKVWQCYKYYMSANPKNDCQKVLHYVLQKLTTQWNQTLSSEDLARLDQEAKGNKKSVEKLSQLALASHLMTSFERLAKMPNHKKLKPILLATNNKQISKAFELIEAFETETRNFAYIIMTQIFLKKNLMEAAKKALDKVPDKEQIKAKLIRKYHKKKRIETTHFQDLFNQVYSRFEELKASYKSRNKKRFILLDQQIQLFSQTISEFESEWLKAFSSEDFERLVEEAYQKDWEPNPKEDFVQKNLRRQLHIYKTKKSHIENIRPIKKALSFGVIDVALELAGKIHNFERRYFAFLLIAEHCLIKNLMKKAKEALDNIPDGTEEKVKFLKAYKEKIAQLETKPKD